MELQDIAEAIQGLILQLYVYIEVKSRSLAEQKGSAIFSSPDVICIVFIVRIMKSADRVH
jgi:hypothetical protein